MGNDNIFNNGIRGRINNDVKEINSATIPNFNQYGVFFQIKSCQRKNKIIIVIIASIMTG